MSRLRCFGGRGRPGDRGGSESSEVEPAVHVDDFAGGVRQEVGGDGGNGQGDVLGLPQRRMGVRPWWMS